jgi:ATP-dependent Clp protease, protease subunit
MKASLNEILATHTGQNVEKVAADTERDFFMSGAEALEYGIVDRVVADRSELEKETEEASKES